MSDGSDGDGPDEINAFVLLIEMTYVYTNIYEYCLNYKDNIGDTDYIPATNSIEEKRKSWLLKSETMLILIALYLNEDLHQSQLGGMIEKNGEKAGSKIQGWIKDDQKLGAFGLIEIKKKWNGNVVYNYYSISKKGRNIMEQIMMDMEEVLKKRFK